MGRAPDPVQVLPGANSPFVDLPVVQETTRTYTEGGLINTVKTTVRSGLPPGTLAPSSGGHEAAVSATCTYTTRDVYLQEHTICGGGCLTQHMQRTFDRFTNTNNNGLHYWDRIEVRLWWTRQYDVQIYFTGDAYTEWDEGFAFDCDGASQGRTVSNSFAPVWYTWDRTYDYYWDETWLPTVTPTYAGPLLNVYTNTPESFGPQLHTEIGVQ
jgi:hypothetical protein